MKKIATNSFPDEEKEGDFTISADLTVISLTSSFGSRAAVSLIFGVRSISLVLMSGINHLPLAVTYYLLPSPVEAPLSPDRFRLLFLRRFC